MAWPLSTSVIGGERDWPAGESGCTTVLEGDGVNDELVMLLLIRQTHPLFVVRQRMVRPNVSCHLDGMTEARPIAGGKKEMYVRVRGLRGGLSPIGYISD